MATLSAANANIVDIVNTLDPGGDAAMIVDTLSQTNSVLNDMQWTVGNLITGNRTTQIASIPTAVARVANQGTTPTKTTHVQVNDACAIIESVSVMDKVVAELGGVDMVDYNRANQARGIIEGLGQKLSDLFFYGTAAVPEEFNGLGVRYNSLSGNLADNVISGGGSGADNASIWVVKHGPTGLMGIVPQGQKSGLSRTDLGLVDIPDATGVAGATLLAYKEFFTWYCGICVKDPYAIARIPNIDVSNLLAKSGAADLTEKLIAATEAIHNPEDGRIVIYMNRTVRKMFRIQRRDDVIAGGGLTYENVDGKRVLMFEDYPVRIVDQLDNTEAAVA
jgi:hypothetical protein